MIVRALSAMRRALPPRKVTITLPGLARAGHVDYDESGRPMIHAQSRFDASRLLGYVVARDRMFQMDLLRRAAGGRLAEFLGASAVTGDRRARLFGFGRVAERAVSGLPEAHRELLHAFSDGVNAWQGSMHPAAFEYEILECMPEPWKPSDSLLVLLGLFDRLCAEIDSKQTLTVMERIFPQEVAQFLSSDEDLFALPLLGGNRSRRPLGPVPVDAFAKILKGRTFAPWPDGNALSVGGPAIGSNAWVLQGDEPERAGTLCANDLHLPLRVPNIAYAAAYEYGAGRMHGFLVPGLPALISGSSNRVSWGVTNFYGDNVDLVAIRKPEGDTDTYLTASGPRRFEHRTERLVVRDGDPIDIEVVDTCWGPVAEKPLLGREIAYRWTALDPRALDLGLCFLEEKNCAYEVLDQARRSGSPPLNVTACDRDGNIGWTIAGRFPHATGDARQSWLEGESLAAEPMRFLECTELPILLNPACGFLVTANNRTIGADFPHDIGRNFANGFRAHRIAACVSARRSPVCSEAVKLQLDTDPGFYDFYRALLLELLPARPEETWQIEIQSAIFGIRDGTDGVGGVVLLRRLRYAIARALLTAWCTDCREVEPSFEYRWLNWEASLRAVLALRHPHTFPFMNDFPDWNAYILATSRRCRADILVATRKRTLMEVKWSDWHIRARHALSATWPELSPLLDMPPWCEPGGPFMVRMMDAGRGAVTRLVVRPGDAAWIQVPGGQSGNPLSRHYRDMHASWVRGRPSLFDGVFVAESSIFANPL